MLPLFFRKNSFLTRHIWLSLSGFRYFSPPIGVLFSIPHGTNTLSVLRQYLELEIDASLHSNPISNGSYSRKNHTQTSKREYIYGLSPSTVLKFQIKFDLSPKSMSIHHISLILLKGFSLFCRFRSPLLNDIAYCFLFLRLLRCFNSAGSQSTRINTKKCTPKVPLGNLGFQRCILRPSLSQLTTTFIGNSSQAIPR